MPFFDSIARLFIPQVVGLIHPQSFPLRIKTEAQTDHHIVTTANMQALSLLHFVPTRSHKWHRNHVNIGKLSSEYWDSGFTIQEYSELKGLLYKSFRRRIRVLNLERDSSRLKVLRDLRPLPDTDIVADFV